jgi:tetratricopeptide (TPR) repeat protein
MRIALSLVALLIVTVVADRLYCSADWRTITPLPDDVVVEPIPSDSSYSPKIAKLSGVWYGEWRWSQSFSAGMEALAGVPVTFVIERFLGPSVQAVYSLGAYERSKAGWMRVLGVIEGDRIVFTIGPNKVKVTLRLRKENSAIGEWDGSGLSFKASLDRKTIGTRVPAVNAGTSMVGQPAPAQAVRWEALRDEAKSLLEQGRYDRAVEVAQEALRVAEKTVGPYHPDAATSLNDLGRLYMTQGWSIQAEPLFVRALEIQEKALGPDHPDVATTLENMADLYRETNRPEEAEILTQRAVRTRAMQK